MMQTMPMWRSMLFLPAHVEKFVAKAHTRGADACILDLEDSVPLDQKAVAREKVAAGANLIASHDVGVLVRINNDNAETLAADIAASVCPGVNALVVPKVNDAEILHSVDILVAAAEQARGLATGSIRLVAQIEDVHALPKLDAIAGACPRLMGMSLGSEDFSASAGMQPTPETLYMPNQMVVFACRRAGILPLGFPSSIAEYSDESAFSQSVRRAAEMGFVGAFCIHPNQARMLNEGFSPSELELEYARELLAAVAEAEKKGQGAFAFRGKMVDPPVISRAEEVLRRVAGRVEDSK